MKSLGGEFMSTVLGCHLGRRLVGDEALTNKNAGTGSSSLSVYAMPTGPPKGVGS